MVQLNILSGKMAGTVWKARRFPVRIGRSAENQLQSEENGVWDRHLTIDFVPRTGFVLRAEPNALVAVNEQPVSEAVALRNGDKLRLGSLNLQFWLAETRQPSYRLREALIWAGIGAVSAGQIALIYLLGV